MNFLQAYGSDDDNDQQQTTAATSSSSLENVNPSTTITAAPSVALSESKQYIVPKDATSLVFNPKYNELYAPRVGPKNPFPTSHTKFDSGFILNGEIDQHNMNSYLFNSQYYNYDVSRKGHLLPGGIDSEQAQSLTTSNDTTTTGVKKKRKRKPNKNGNSSISEEAQDNNETNFVIVNEEDDADVIAGFDQDAFIQEDENENEHEQLLAQLRAQHEEQLAKRKEKLANAAKEKQEKENETGNKKRKKEVEGTLPEIEFNPDIEKKITTEGKDGYSIYHLPRDMDYQGRTFIVPPSHIKPCDYTEKRAVLPKKLIHTYTGHMPDKMVTSIEFFPRYGHLLLSASMDATIKIWDVLGHRNCVMTYVGHTKAVRAISFSSDGSKFASCAYDKRVNIWDAETGKILHTLTSGSTPYCVKWNPLEHKQHEILVGYSGSRILQWDTRSGRIVHKYERHTGSVNSLCFVDGGKKFVSSSDDKSVRLWEYGIPAEIKKLADPEQHSMPVIECHPNSKWVVAQSLDNQILTFEAQTRLKQQQNKIFKGHQIAGYACQVGFSNDGKFVFSGDYTGNVWFWNWKDATQIKKMQCHEGICIGCVWHPVDRSLFATCGSDSTIKLFQ
ncbi:hypothetical protein C9374_006011 [Naegleria lovaniensis]|uniref:Pre-mRNA-processing factor 17 n=1 Tax=Naegleria lovaniensis TaxID=51637 RepID=A0AA88GNM7_NAELO|nr:uncharacterized protein C9374_006011 [Naegleria lovaniensis]KAG2381627.1 hypothetical protein C9374_006011 [Naegleria lovaniensis]